MSKPLRDTNLQVNQIEAHALLNILQQQDDYDEGGVLQYVEAQLRLIVADVVLEVKPGLDL